MGDVRTGDIRPDDVRAARRIVRSRAPLSVTAKGERDMVTDVDLAVDPVDGTANLARGVPLCAVSPALGAGRRSVLAAIDMPFLDTCYTAVAGHGTYLGDERVHASGVDDLSEA
jgi:myo-inositol-1(or 4)-monophosphatase